MKMAQYEHPKILILELIADDVITTSGNNPGPGYPGGNNPPPDDPFPDTGEWDTIM